MVRASVSSRLSSRDSTRDRQAVKARRPSAITACAVCAWLTIAWTGLHLPSPAHAQRARTPDEGWTPPRLSGWVDPFIGTAGLGGVFPGAMVPWGMASPSPHTSTSAPGGYRHGDAIIGFGQVHFSGSPAALGMLLVSATSSDQRQPIPPAMPRNERAEPGYYGVSLPSQGVTVEATATERTAFYRITFARGSSKRIALDATHALGRQRGERLSGNVTLAGLSRVEGWSESARVGGLGGRARLYFSAELFGPADAVQVRRDGSWGAATERGGERVEALLFLRTADTATALLRIGLSYVDVAGARANLRAEQSGWDFEETRRSARARWDAELSHIVVNGGADSDRTLFYSALYRSLLHPSVFSDIDGRYRTFKTGRIQRTDSARYSGFSLWDTYRTVHPLLALAYPARSAGMVRSLLAMQREGSWMPLWELAGQESNAMVGDPASIVVAEAFVKGILHDGAAPALLALRQNATRMPPWRAEAGQSKGRIAVDDYVRYGFVPEPEPPGARARARRWLTALLARARNRFAPETYEHARLYGSVSTTQEYALADACIAGMAGVIGDSAVARAYERRSLGYRALFDSSARWDGKGARVGGFFRPRMAGGAWVSTPAFPAPSQPRTQTRGFVEGDEWSYLFAAPHDVAGLAMLAGGRQALVNRLEAYFTLGAHDMSNEPSIGYAHLFNELGEAGRTQARVRGSLRQFFSVRADGLPGQDDAGTLSAWVVWSAIGLYPVLPCRSELSVTTPLFREILVKSRGVDVDFRIVADRDPASSPYIRTASIGGRPLGTLHVAHSALRLGAELKLQLSAAAVGTRPATSAPRSSGSSRVPAGTP